MRIAPIVAAVLCAATAARAEWKPPTKGDVAMLLATESLLALDCLTSIDGQRNRPGWYEKNWLLGKHPSTEATYLYFAGTMLATGALWYALPPPWRKPTMALLQFAEIAVVSSNLRLGAHIRF